MPRPPRITLYTRKGCAHCKSARDFLKAQGIAFREAPIDSNRRAASEFQRLGARSVPVTLIREQRLIGFEAKRWRVALRDAGFKLA